ncbi:MAG: putative deoxycytidylate deaminase [Prokaryotic dsDNA virus sp.]|nr:MAG: putative deoxycytidylate deaminase [Prokaryotic dsDNA virus sp.]
MSKHKHIWTKIRMSQQLAQASPCPRAKVGAMLFQPDTWVTLADGYNGAPRGGGDLCGGTVCHRDEQKIVSGTRVEVGCHHAEANAICNAARYGHATKGAWLVVTRPPCLNCAKLIHHAGITQVYTTKHDRDSPGCAYLIEHNITVISWE